MLKIPMTPEDLRSSPSEAQRLYESLAKQYQMPLRGPAIDTPPAKAVQHLEYGGVGPAKAQGEYRHNCSSYKRGPGRPKGLQFKSAKRLELIARLENAGIGEWQCATMIGISVPRLRSLKRSPDYLKARVLITHGLIMDTEASLAEIKEQRKEMLTQLLPPALRVIANAVQQPPTTPAERMFQVRVAQDVLDREGTYARISRSEVRSEARFDWSTQEHSAREVISIVRGSGAFQAESPDGQLAAARLIEITRKFAAGQTVSEAGSDQAMKVIEMAPIEQEEAEGRVSRD